MREKRFIVAGAVIGALLLLSLIVFRRPILHYLFFDVMFDYLWSDRISN